MTFLEALKARRPMRRAWVTGHSPWLWLGKDENGFGPDRHIWREIDTGKHVGLSPYDYEAGDWEVMS